MKIVFLIRSLNRGGAERQLVLLASRLKQAGHAVSVLTFYSGGAFEMDLAAYGVPIISLGKSSRWSLPDFFARLVSIVREIDPHLLHGYLPSGNLLALAVRPFARNVKIVIGVRSSTMDLARFDIITRLSYWAERRLARVADLIIVNSKAGGERYRMAVRGRVPVIEIPNGFDTDTFAPDPTMRMKMREMLKIGDNESVIGFTARIDPMKDHDTFFAAAALAHRRVANLRFMCVGGGAPEVMARLQAKADVMGLGARVLWTGERDDPAALYNAMDVATLVSRGEGFPNVVGEAMACGAPCVASDVGAVSEIVGDTGLVVPPGDAMALANGWLAMLERIDEAGPSLGERARRRIVERFGLDILVERSLAAFRSVLPETE